MMESQKILNFPKFKQSIAKKQILIVDSAEDIRTMLRSKFSRVFPQAQFKDAYSGMTASVELARSTYDLVVSDVNMPNGDGVWLHFFMEQYHSNTPLVFFASSPDHIPAVARSRKAFAKTDADGLLSALLDVWGGDETR